MRLIDADALIELFKNLRDEHETTHISYNALYEVILQQKTAYDVEAVVAELEKYRAGFDCRICKHGKTEKQVCTKDCTDALVDGFLEVVRNGGKE